MKLGFIAANFESKNNIAAISNTKGDPGGKSYGKFQLSKATLLGYVARSIFKDLVVESPFTKEFDIAWKQVCKYYPSEFEIEQDTYITITHYLPVAIFAKEIGYDTSSRKLQEAIFSIAVQHGGAKQILKQAIAFDTLSEVEKLYAARRLYVEELNISGILKVALYKRYDDEILAVLGIDE